MNKVAKALLRDETCGTCINLSWYQLVTGEIRDSCCCHKDRIADLPAALTCELWAAGATMKEVLGD